MNPTHNIVLQGGPRDGERRNGARDLGAITFGRHRGHDHQFVVYAPSIGIDPATQRTVFIYRGVQFFDSDRLEATGLPKIEIV